MDAGIALDYDGDPRPLLLGHDIGYDEVETLQWRLLLPFLSR